MNRPDFIYPDWVVPDHVFACCTTRTGGVSEGAYRSLNLADHVGDDGLQVARNRAILANALPTAPQWLEQTHSIRAIDLDHEDTRDGDAAFTRTPNRIAVVLTADCLPVLFCNFDGTEVAAAHAGWRGLLNGVLEQTVQGMRSPAGELSAWLGPAIGPDHFEVGEEVREAFLADDKNNAPSFTPTRPGHWLADLYAIARRRLKRLGVSHISGGEFCTYRDAGRFFSYRRERDTGRQASLIYIKQ